MRATRGASLASGVSPSDGTFLHYVFSLSITKSVCRLRIDASVDISDAKYAIFVEFSW